MFPPGTVAAPPALLRREKKYVKMMKMKQVVCERQMGVFMIKTVIFDIDNTLYNYDQAHVHAMEAVETYFLTRFGIAGEEMKSRYLQAQDMVSKRIGTDTAAIHNRLLRFQCMMEEMHLPPFPHARTLYHIYWDTLLHFMIPSPGIYTFMESLRQRGIRMGIGSDMTTYVQYQKLEQLGLAPLIDWVVTSEEAGVEKPHPDFFRLCIKKAHCNPEECLFIGDSLKKDVQGALDAGMHGVWFSQGIQPEKTPAFPVIVSFADTDVDALCRL